MLTDAELWTQAAQGNMNAFDELYRRYWPALLDEAYKRLKCREEAEDVVQNLFIELYDRIPHTHIRNEVSGYLFRSVQYAVYKRMRKYITDRRRFNDLEKHHLTALENIINSDLEYKELERSIQQAIDSLPGKCRNAFLLNRNEQYSYKHVALCMDISERTVEKHISKALTILRKKLGLFYSSLLLLIMLYM